MAVTKIRMKDLPSNHKECIRAGNRYNGTPVKYWPMTARKAALATGWSSEMAEFVMKASKKKMIN